MALTPLSRKITYYSDFDENLLANPVSSDVALKLNENAIKNSIRNLILTRRGERPFQPNLGCDVHSLLFENITPDILENIRNMIFETIGAYEPRADVHSVDVTATYDETEVHVSIVFSVINIEEPITLDVILNRVR